MITKFKNGEYHRSPKNGRLQHVSTHRWFPSSFGFGLFVKKCASDGSSEIFAFVLLYCICFYLPIVCENFAQRWYGGFSYFLKFCIYSIHNAYSVFITNKHDILYFFLQIP